MQASTRDPAEDAGPPSAWERVLAKVGHGAENFAHHAYGIGMICWRTLYYLFTGRVALRDVVTQIYWMGAQSMGIVLVTSTLSGIVTSQQGGYQFSGSVPLYVLGSVVSQSVILELGPVLTAVVLIGRVGARITAELGTMQVSEQIDALYSLGRDPVRTLVSPRIIAGLISVPLLVGFADCIGMISGMLAARLTLGLGQESFFYGARLFWHNWDLLYSLTKGFVFGGVIPLVAAHMGLSTRGGAEGVGKSTTSAVVAMTLAVLILDAMFPPLMLQ